MLDYIKRNIPNTHSGIGLVIFSICNSQLSQKVRYNGFIDQFEVPLSTLSMYKQELLMSRQQKGNLGNTPISYDINFNDKIFRFGID